MATIKDIAKITGCSVMTVSRALNNPELVKEETRNKILAASQKVGYVQNRGARALVKRCTFNICVYIPSSLEATETFVAQTVSSIGEQLGKLGYSLSLCRKISPEHNFDGVIAVGLHIEEEDAFISLSKQKPAAHRPINSTTHTMLTRVGYGLRRVGREVFHARRIQQQSFVFSRRGGNNARQQRRERLG